MSNYLTLTPAYGRDYKSGKEVETAWKDGKDFVIADVFHPDSGRYVNINDAPSGVTLNIRYKRNTQVKVIRVK